MSPAVEKLSRREREIMEVLFALGNSGSAEEIRERLTDSPSYSAVRAMLAKLEAKGFVRHREAGLKYIYTPTTPRTTAQRKALQRLISVFFAGSASETAAALLKHEQWTDEEIDRLQAEIDRVRKHRKQP
jgi:BlaI family transcriptional regulator, penicillinase repressor